MNLDYKTVASWCVVALLLGFFMQIGNKMAENVWPDKPIQIIDITEVE